MATPARDTPIRVNVVIDPRTRGLLTQFGELAKPEVMTAMELTMQGAEAVTAKATPVNVGILRASVFGAAVDFWPKVIGVLGSPLSYAEPVEYGSKPHKPPYAPILLWVRRKLGGALRLELRQESTSGRVSRASMESRIRSVAWAVVMKIAREGTVGHHMFEQGMRHALQLAPRLLERAMRNLERRFSDR